jgi:exodeoxyribonuclease VII, small subunit
MTKTYDFETALSELESVTQQMDGEVKLEAALDLYERGIQLSRQCEDFLRGAAQRIEILRVRQDGTIETEPFDSVGSPAAPAPNSQIEIESGEVSVRLQKKAGKRSSETSQASDSTLDGSQASQLSFELANQP